MPRKDPEERRAYLRAYYLDHREKLRTRSQFWHARHREKALARQRAYLAKNRARIYAKNRAYHGAHTEENAARSKAWREANPERERANKRTYFLKHPEKWAATTRRRRARKARSTLNDFTAAQWEEMKAAYGYRCVYCGRQMERLTQDHITPLSKGGRHTAANIVPACRTCNGRKQDGAVLVPIQPVLLLLAPPHRERKKA